MSNELICPKCGSSMRSYERNGVVVDQCTGCGGLFLDKGELEKLSAAESSYYQSQQAPPPAPQPTASAPQHQSGYKENRDRDCSKPKKKKSKKSFLEDLLEF